MIQSESKKISFVHRKACPLCDSKDTQTLFQQKFVEGKTWEFIERYYSGRVSAQALNDQNFIVVQCNSCDFVYQQDILNDQGMQTLYEEWISPQQSMEKQRASSDAKSPAIATQVQTIARLIGRSPSQCKVLDFGMGWGHWCQMAQAHGYGAHGLELSKTRIEAAEKRGVEVIRTLDGWENTFDFVNCEQALEHVPDPVSTLQLIHKVLRPGGYTRVSVPNGANLPARIRGQKWKPAKDSIHPLEHINSFSNATLKRCAQQADLLLARQPILNHPVTSHLGLLRNRVLPHYLVRRSTNLYFRSPVEH